MSSSKTAPRWAKLATVGATLALVLCSSAAAVTLKPTATTGAATHVLGTSALITAAINPRGVETSYYFQYGPTTAYGSQTPTTPVGNGLERKKVGQSIGRLAPGATYHFRVVAVSTPNPALIYVIGHDHAFKAKGAALVFSVPRTAVDTYGSPFVLTGTLTGFGSALHRIALQASPFPYLEPFSTIGLPDTTNALGRFSFRVANLTASTQLRITTLDPLPIYSPIVTLQLAPHIVLHVHSSSHAGIVRLYGTITPAVNGARVAFQVQKAVRPGKSEITTRWVGQFSTKAKRAGSNSSRFSMVLTLRHSGRYRAYVRLHPGRLVSGASTNTIVLKA